jgi:protein-L-isoaspartate(D-aspartate) O-methyltransferase
MSDAEKKYTVRRQRMVSQQLLARGLKDEAVLGAMATVPRHRFVAPAYAELAYEDMPLSIPAGQTISQPYIVAYMISLLRLQTSDRVLEIGTGSGYAAAVLSLLAREVYGVERHEKLVSAGGPVVPESLRAQLAVGGRLVMPVGHRPRLQDLICLTRLSETEYRSEEMGAVAFVPLVGEAAWPGTLDKAEAD